MSGSFSQLFLSRFEGELRCLRLSSEVDDDYRQGSLLLRTSVVVVRTHIEGREVWQTLQIMSSVLGAQPDGTTVAVEQEGDWNE